MNDADPHASVDSIAHQLSGLFWELYTGTPTSAVAGVSLADAAAMGRVERLYLFQCDTDDLDLVSTFRRWWEVNGVGFRWIERWPITQEMLQSERLGVEFPFVKFATDGQRVRFGMRFGPSWYEAREGALVVGRFDPTNLVDPYLPRE